MTIDRQRQHPSERFAVDSLKLDIREEIRSLRSEGEPVTSGHRQKTLFKHGGRTIALFVMDADARMAEHAAAGTVTVQPIEGALRLTVGADEERLTAGEILVIAPNIRHSVYAVEASAFLLQISMEPSA